MTTPQKMEKETFLSTLHTSRSELDRALAQVDESRLEEPGVSGFMSVKDILAHITWFEKEMLAVLDQRTLAGSNWWDLPAGERNQHIFATNRDRPLAEVRASAQQVYALLLQALEGLEENELNDPSRFRNMPPDWIPYQLLAGNTYDHYDHHAADIRRWLAAQGG